MITRQQALFARHGQILHYTGPNRIGRLQPCVRVIGPRGGVHIEVIRARITGRCQTWARRPDDFRLPICHGLREHGSVTCDNAEHWHLEADCPLVTDT